MRNLAEKLRRDKLNTYVGELASIIPLVAAAGKKVDKTSVLRIAANYIRMHNGECVLLPTIHACITVSAYSCQLHTHA
jgi:hypothetical protein